MAGVGWNGCVAGGVRSLSFVSAFVFHLAFLIAAAGSQALPGPVQSPTPQQQPVSPKLTQAEVSDLKVKAEQGDAVAQWTLGKAYEQGNGVAPNANSAAIWYRKAADQGNAAAENDLGIMYRIGDGVNRDKEEAVRWYRKAAKQGNPQSLFNLGVSYYNGDGVPSDPISAYAWFLLAEEAGNPAATDAVKRSAAEGGRLGTPEALLQIATMCEKGDDLPQSYSEAAKWYRKATDVSPRASVNLASMLIEGKGVPPDYGQAMTLCKSAAKRSFPPGNYCVGYLYERGLGTPVDPKEAAKWYGEASKGGLHQAMMKLAEMYWKGEGVGVNRPEAYYFLYLASRRGAPDAKTRAQILWKEMSKDEIKHLEKKLRDARFDPQKVFASMQDRTTPDAANGVSRP